MNPVARDVNDEVGCSFTGRQPLRMHDWVWIFVDSRMRNVGTRLFWRLRDVLL